MCKMDMKLCIKLNIFTLTDESHPFDRRSVIAVIVEDYFETFKIINSAQGFETRVKVRMKIEDPRTGNQLEFGLVAVVCSHFRSTKMQNADWFNFALCFSHPKPKSIRIFRYHFFHFARNTNLVGVKS